MKDTLLLDAVEEVNDILLQMLENKLIGPGKLQIARDRLYEVKRALVREKQHVHQKAL